MAAGRRFSLILSVIALIVLSLPLYARTDPTVTSVLSRDTLALDACLTNTVRVTLAADWPEMSYCVFPEKPDPRDAFSLLASYPSTLLSKTPDGKTQRVFETRYVLRAQYAGQARLGNVYIYIVDGETMQTNRLPLPDSAVLIEESGSYSALLYILIALGISALVAFAVYFSYTMIKRRN